MVAIILLGLGSMTDLIGSKCKGGWHRCNFEWDWNKNFEMFYGFRGSSSTVKIIEHGFIPENGKTYCIMCRLYAFLAAFKKEMNK